VGRRRQDGGAAGAEPAARLGAAFDEARFGPAGILNLRASLPTGEEAARRADAWLRMRQAAGAGDVLVITGRGRGSLDGIPAVRDAVVRLFSALRRSGVVADVREHTAGAFVVRLAPLRALVEAPRRQRRSPPLRPREPAAVAGLEPETRAALHRLAVLALTALGVQRPADGFVEDEMARQLASLVRTVPDGPDRERALRAVLSRAIAEYENA